MHIYQGDKGPVDVQVGDEYVFELSTDPFEVRVGNGPGTVISTVTYKKVGGKASFNVEAGEDVTNAKFSVKAEMKSS